jgi:hypothetical protein
MSVGKYSPVCPHAHEPGWDAFRFNAYGKPPEPWNDEVQAAGVVYDQKTMFENYDGEGYDSYGYSAFDADGEYVGIGDGVDRCGYTEMDYLIDAGNGGDLHSTASPLRVIDAQKV